MDLVKPRQQQIWRLPAVINFTLGSMGAGYYVWTQCAALVGGRAAAVEGAATLAGVVAVGLILGGFFALLFEAGNPLKSYLTILNVRHSWMSRELLLALIFMGLIGLDAFFPGAALRSIAGATAFLFIVSQAFIVYKSRAIVSWNVWPILPMFTLTGLSSGYGLYLMLERGKAIGWPMIILGGATWLMCLGMFLFYLLGFRGQDADFRAATRQLRTAGSLGLGAGVGLVLPLLLLGAAGAAWAASVSATLFAGAGAGAVLGAWQRNRDLVMKAGYFRRIGINL